MKLSTALNTWFRTIHPNHGAILRGMAWVILFVFIGKIMGAGKEMAVAYRYGVAAEVDAYLFVLNVVNWPTAVFFSVLTLVLVPLVSRLRTEDKTFLPYWRAELLGATLLVGLALMGLTWLVLHLLLRSPWSGLPAGTAVMAVDTVPGLVATVPLALLISLFSAWMLANGRHTNTLLEGVPALVIIVVILGYVDGGIDPLVWGTVAGTLFHVISLGIPLRRIGQLEAPRFSHRSEAWPAFWQGFGVMLVGNALMNLIVMADLFFAAHLGTGSIATLSYANRILALLLGLAGTAVSRATLPVFSKAGERGGVAQLAIQWARLMLIIGAFSMLIAWWLAPYAVKLLFERGAFKTEDTQAVTEVLRYGLVQLPFYFAALVLVSGLVSRGMHRWVALGAVINLFVKVAGNFLLVPLLGVSGLILATGLMYLVSFLMLYRISLGVPRLDLRSHI